MGKLLRFVLPLSSMGKEPKLMFFDYLTLEDEGTTAVETLKLHTLTVRCHILTVWCHALTVRCYVTTVRCQDLAERCHTVS